MKNAGVESCAVYVPCNLAEESWKEKLLSSSYKPEKMSFSSLLGISYYLTKSEFKSLVELLSSIISEGSCLCFDYPTENESIETRTNQALANGAGEKMKALYKKSEIEKMLSECGLLISEHLEKDEMNKRYFSDYNKNNPEHLMESPEGVAYLLAVKK